MHAASTLRNELSRRWMTALLAALVLGPVVLAAPTKRPAKVLDAKADRLQALQAAHPTLSPEAVQQRLVRLEKAWGRAEAKGLLKAEAWLEGRQEGQRVVLGKAFLDTKPGHGALTEAQVKASYLGQGEDRRVSHVLCKTQEEIDAAHKRLLAGESLEKVAMEVSIDPSAATNRGDLGWINAKQVVAAFGGPVFAAPLGALVGPIKSEYGWHLAKAWEARTKTEQDYERERESLLKEAAKMQINMKRDGAMAPLRTRYPLKPDMAMLGADRTTEYLPGDEKKVAGRVAGVAITMKAMKQHLVAVLKTMGQSHTLGAGTKARFMEGLADEIRLETAARKQGLDRRPAVQAALWVDERERAYAAYTQAFCAEAQVAEAELVKHHAAFPDRFRRVGALRLQVLVAESQVRVEEALGKIQMGLPWLAAVAEYANAEATGNPEPGWVEVADLQKMVPPTLMLPLLAGTLGQPVGPMLGPDGFMLFSALERRPGPVMKLEDCRDAVREDYLKVHGQALTDQSLTTE